MSTPYWQKRDSIKRYITVGLRQLLMERYGGVPVIVLRNSAEKMRADNKAWVKQVLKNFDCEEFNVSWQVSFEYVLDENRTAIVSDFTITVEGN
jgi:hypothetical protein